MLQHEDRSRVPEILRDIRSGRTPKAVLDATKVPNQTSAQGDPAVLAINTFLIALAHSTGSVQDIVSLGVRTLNDSAEVPLPEPEYFHQLRHQIVYISRLEELLQNNKRKSAPQTISSTLHSTTASTNRESTAAISSDPQQEGTLTRQQWPAPHSVRAAPWTSISSSDEAISHLVSLFLTWINPHWRFVEEDLFLRGQFTVSTHRGKQVKSH